MSAPPCLICDLTRCLHSAYSEASTTRKALQVMATDNPVMLRTAYAKAVERRCADVAKDLFRITSHRHTERLG